MRKDAIKRDDPDRPAIGPVLEHYGIHFNPFVREQLILCPAHSEDHPSCSLNVDAGLWNCHACTAAGDVYTLVMMKENLDFQAAVARIAQILGDGDGSVPRRSRRVSGNGAPAVAGYQPRFRRAIPAGARFRTNPRV